MFRRTARNRPQQQQAPQFNQSMMFQNQIPMQQMPYGQMPMDMNPFGRRPLIHPKGYVPKGGAGPNMNGIPEASDMLRSAVRYISPAVFHPGEPGKNVSQNVLSVELGALYRKVDLATGDPVRCKQCHAIFCASDAPCLVKGDKMEDGEEPSREWTCKYCGCKQEIDIDDAEIPTRNVSEYVVVPGAADDGNAAAAAGAGSADAAAGAPAADDDCYVVFCVDVSGSMSITSLQGNEYVSKLACVAGAVYSQMDALKHEHPNRRVCLITFGSDVDVFNGTEHKQMSGVTLSDWDSVVKFAEDIKVDSPVSTVFDSLAEEVIYMSERGATALGPALLSAITIASRKRGSYVVLCTDGMANQGIGSLEGLQIKDSDTEKSPVELLYERFGDTAKDAGVTVSVIGIKGAECRMENLGVVADKSGGNVDLADPENVDFSGTLEEPVVATNVSVVLRVDPAFIFDNGTNSLPSEVGNVKRLTQKQCALFSAPDGKPPSEVRMQCEITFTKVDGSVHLRVIEKIVPYMDDINKAVDGINVALVGGYVSRTAAQMAHEGEVESAGQFSQGYQDKLNEYIGVQSRVDEEQRTMMTRFTCQNSLAQNLVGTSISQQRAGGMSNFAASRQRSDYMSTNIYQMRSDAGAQACLIM